MKKFYLSGLMALGLMFTGCSDDTPENPNNVPTEGERTLYVNVNIRGDVEGLNSRAAQNDGKPVEGEDGTDFAGGESDVTSAYFVFYDNNGNPVGSGPIPINLADLVWKTGANGTTVDKYAQSVVGVTIGNNEENPSQVVCYLNPEDVSNLSLSLKDIQEKTREILYTEKGDEKYFPMSNSVFYTSTTSEAPQIAVQIAPDQLFNTRQAAQDALEGDNASAYTVNIYVERYAAKLKFKTTDPKDYITESRNINSDNGTQVTLTFVPKTWMLNASCDETYVVKSFREESATGDILADNYGYQELDNIINKNLTTGGWEWNNSGYNRSYWGMSPAYFTSAYPEVSSDVAGLTLHQHYYSYDELLNGIGGKQPVGFALPTTADGVTEYVHETTVGSKALASKNIVAALPSVILVGDYTLKFGSQELTDIDFYTYGVVSGSNDHALVYFDSKENSTTGESVYADTESILRGLIKGATNLYKYIPATNKYVNFDLENDDDIAKLVAVFEVAAPGEAVKGNLKVPERYRTLQLRDGVTADQLDGIYVGTNEGYMTIATTTTPAADQLTITATNQEMMKVVGFCAKYQAGAAYFNIPVKHYGWYRAGNENNKPDATMNWSKVRVGDFGVVRNHSYSINVTEILGLGTGIGDKTNPIVPPAEENRYYVAYSVNILKWAVVPEQEAKL